MIEVTAFTLRHIVRVATDDELELLAAALKGTPLKGAATDSLLEEISACQAYRAKYRSPQTA